MAQDHQAFMRVALEVAEETGAEGNDAIGSILVRGQTVVARGGNLTSANKDPTAHAETVALRAAGAALGGTDLSSCTLYTTFEPCPMCAGAIMVSGVPLVVIGARPDPSVRRFGPYTLESFLEWSGWNDRISVVGGVLPEECLEMRLKWQSQR